MPCLEKRTPQTLYARNASKLLLIETVSAAVCSGTGAASAVLYFQIPIVSVESAKSMIKMTITATVHGETAELELDVLAELGITLAEWVALTSGEREQETDGLYRAYLPNILDAGYEVTAK